MEPNMPKWKVQNENFSLVFVGTFSPLNFTPDLLFARKCIAKEDYEQIRSEQNGKVFISSSLVVFETEFLDVEITQTKFSVFLKKRPLNMLLDFVKSLFGDLTAISIKAFGINYQCLYSIFDVHDFQLIGDRLAPKSFWHELLKDEISGDNRKSGLTNITMQKNKDGEEKGTINVALAPSSLAKPFGVVISVNDHCQSKESVTMGDVLDYLDHHFFASISRSATIEISLLTDIFNHEINN